MNSPAKAVAVVTGGASGIGEACAESLAESGWRVVVADIADGRGSAVAKRIGGEYYHMDVGDAAGVEEAAAAIESRVGPVTGLVTSAGVIQRPLPPQELALDQWDNIVRIDQRGTYVSCVAFGRRMAARGTGGAIVNIASVAGSRSMPLHAYSPAKAAVISMTACLSVAWGRDGIRVNSVSPGFTATPALQVEIDAGRRDISRLVCNAALNRLVKPSEVAAVVTFLLSPAASAVTGIDLPVDCGWLAASTWGTYGGPPSPTQRSI